MLLPTELTTSSILGSSLAAFAIWYIVSAFRTWYRLRHIPGPFLASFSYTWHVSKLIRGKGQEYGDLHKKYNSTFVRTGPNYVLTCDPEVFRYVNGPRSPYPRDPWFLATRIDSQQNHLLSSIDIASHDKRKAKMAAGYNGRDIVDMEGAVDRTIASLVDAIRRSYLSTGPKVKPVDFAALSRYFTLDIITLIGFGKAFGFLQNHDLYGYVKSVDALVPLIATGGELPLLRDIFVSPLLGPFFAPKVTDNVGVGRVLRRGQEIVAARYKNEPKGKGDMIDAFMSHGVTEKECSAEVALQIIAGSDTTAVTIRSTMLHIMTNPRVYSRFKAEIKEAIDQGKASRPIMQAEAKKLPYLQAIIYEGLRIRSPLVYGFYKRVPPEGDTINGVYLPGNTSIGVNMIAISRDKAIFGQDAEIFRPERFLECDEQKRLEMQQTAELAFGYGRWTCAGKMVAFAELNKTLFELMREFDYEIMYPGNPWEEFAYTAWIQKNMWVKITVAM